MSAEAPRNRLLERLVYERLGTAGRILFAKIQERAERDAAYAAELSIWLKRGRTVHLRDVLASPFGGARDNAHFNAWADIDSAISPARAEARKAEA